MTTHVLMITDSSGSMQPLANDVRGGHNAYLDQLAAGPDADDYRITLTLFDNRVYPVERDVPVAQAKRLDEHSYIPGGSTALLDAIGNTVRSFRDEVLLPPEDKVLVIIQTDGEENASQEWTRNAVTVQRRELEALGWVFAFHGAGPGGWTERDAFGVGTRSAHTSHGTRTTYDSYAVSTQTMSRAGGQSMNSADFAEMTQAEIDAQGGGADAAP